jgi:hypothetical protein
MDSASSALGFAAGWRSSLPEKRYRIKTEPFGNALQALEGQVALATLDATHVSPMHTEHVGKGLLAESLGFAVGPQIAAYGSL